MNGTLYINESDEWIWTLARKYAGNRLSRVVLDILRDYVADRMLINAQRHLLERGEVFFDPVAFVVIDQARGRLRGTMAAKERPDAAALEHLIDESGMV
jgi:hypothetical protein